MGAFTYRHLFGLLVAHFFLPDTEAECPSPWLTHGSYCYSVIAVPRTWMGAEIACQNIGTNGHLASFFKEIDHSSVVNYLKSNFQGLGELWIGLHDPRRTRNWEWIDNTPLFYQSWDICEPNNEGGNKYCVIISGKTGFLKWTTVDCKRELPALCRTKL
ncbi:C-type lectin BfL-2-like [Paroedura picta]|uniref:C-type lectin BfL-2-like n=1 Tax=Paroedura picta TaxID=143630 RepID=UPI00405603E1